VVIDLIKDGFFSRGNSEMFRDLIDNLLHYDPTWCWLTTAPMRNASSGGCGLW